MICFACSPNTWRSQVRGNENWNEAPEIARYPRVLPSALACEQACLALRGCASGLWLSGATRHGDCYLTSGVAVGARHDFCAVNPQQQCVGFVRRNASQSLHHTIDP